MALTPHLSTRKGKRVHVIMKSGEVIIDKFVERTSRYVVLEQRGKLRTEHVRALSDYRADKERECPPA